MTLDNESTLLRFAASSQRFTLTVQLPWAIAMLEPIKGLAVISCGSVCKAEEQYQASKLERSQA